MSNRVRVWDPLVRIFHWGLVLGFTIGYLTGEEDNIIHIYSGYVVLGLITFRVLWGFIGTPYARFRNFVYSPMTVAQYMQDLFAGKPKHYLGHNPAGGWMIIVMLLTLFVVSISGLKVYAIEEGLGPLASESSAWSVVGTARAYEDDNDDDEHEESEEYEHGESDEYENGHHESEEQEEFWEEIHQTASNFMLLLIILHIAGVILSSRLHGENLVKAMISGVKIQKTDV